MGNFDEPKPLLGKKQTSVDLTVVDHFQPGIAG